jgi:acyl carrier protein
MDAMVTENTLQAIARDKAAIVGWLVAKFALITGGDEADIDVERPFADYALDSSVAVSVAAELGLWVGQELSVTLFWEFPSIAELADALADGAQPASLF